MKIGDIAVLPDKKDIDKPLYSNEGSHACGYVEGYNQALDELSQIEIDPEKIPIDREALAKIIWIKITNPSMSIIKDWDSNSPFAVKYWKPGYLGIADTLISSKVTWLGKV